MTTISMALYEVLRELNISEDKAHRVAIDVVTVSMIEHLVTKKDLEVAVVQLRAEFANGLANQTKWTAIMVFSATAIIISAVAALVKL